MKKVKQRHLLQLCLLKTEVTLQGMSFLFNRDKTEKHAPKEGARARVANPMATATRKHV